jgi:predicted membrane channel-forming protein YqfA (hemolysin III family)
MSTEQSEREANAIRVLMTIAFALLFIAIIALGMGQQSATRLYVIIALRFLLGALAVFLIAFLFWSINWIKKNVKIR